MREIDRPLGQTLRQQKKPRRQIGIRRSAIIAAASVGGILAVSTLIALREDGLERPAPVVVAVAKPEPPAPAKAVEPAKPVQPPPPVEALSAEGAKIIKVPREQLPAPAATGTITVSDPSAANFNPRTAHMPDRALIEESPEGPLPKRGADGRRPADAYARPWSGTRGARVAIVIGGLAVSQTGTQSAIGRLPPEVTLAFASQGNSIQRWMQSARQRGHEILMQVPLEPFDYPTVNPGRATLTVDAAPQENIDNLHWALARTTNYTGVMNYMGGRFVADARATGSMMAELGKRGLLYLEDGTTARSTAPDQAVKNGVPVATS
ncbi:MAG: divergent polysaccharide deacetylase family protein, partial [Rhizobiaceae bacterium]